MLMSASFIKNLVLFGAVLLAVSGCSLITDRNVTLKYYQIGGTSLKQIDSEIRKKGPRINGVQHAVAVSNIKMTPDIALTSSPKGCIVTRARIKVHTIITLPRWENRSGADQKLAQAWDNLDRYTRLHEAVHVSIAQKYATKLELSLRTMKTAKTCKETGNIARMIIRDSMQNHEREQLRFDASEKARFAKLAKRNKSS